MMNRLPLLMTLVLVADSRFAASAVLFSDPVMFRDATRSDLLVEDFQSIPITSGDFGAFGNGTAFRGFTLASLTFAGDIPLVDAGLNLTGLSGTFLAQRNNEGDIFVRPGGQGPAGDPADNDDFRFDLLTPAVAFGLPIADNRTGESGESVRFLGAGDVPIASAPLPGGPSGSGEDGFIGLLIEPGDPLIHAVVVLEGSTLDDDIVIDNVLVQPVPEPRSSLLALLGLAPLTWSTKWPYPS